MLTELFLKSFISFFVMANPIGVSMIFVGLVTYAEPKEIRDTARKSIFVALGILLVFAVFGAIILEKFGISIPAFQVSGGVLLFSIASKKLFGDNLAQAHPSDRQALTDKDDITIFPLAIPLIAGPGSITLIIIMMSQASNYTESVVVFAAMLLVMGIMWACFRAARRIRTVLGWGGINLVTRLMGILLAARSVQIIADGIQGLNFNFNG